MIAETINQLIAYARIHLGMSDEDSLYFKNILLGELKVGKPSEEEVDVKKVSQMKVPDEFIDQIQEYLVNELKYSEHDAELFATKLMGFISPLPSIVTHNFNELEKVNDRKALDYLYDLSIKNNYVAKTKIDRNLLWESNFEDKNIEISVNLSKPEKNNKDIAKLIAKTTSNEEKYPKCLLCYENLGFYGNEKHPARENIIKNI